MMICFVFAFRKKYMDIGTIATKQIGVSFDIRAKKKYTPERMRCSIFFVSMYLKLCSMHSEVNNKARISSLLLILAITSVCMGCNSKSNVIKNGTKGE